MKKPKEPQVTPANDELDDEQLDAVAGGRRRATFSGACVTEVKLDDLDANNNKKPYQTT